MSVHEVTEGLQEQSATEQIIWSIDVSAVTGTPTNPAVDRVYDITADAAVTTAVMPSGSVTTSGGTLTLPKLQSLAAGHTYRVEVKFADGSSTLERFFRVRCPF